MSNVPPVLSQLIFALRSLPGVGPRSAERLAYHLLQSKDRGFHLAETLIQALDTLKPCEWCHAYTDLSVCERCQDPKRDNTLLCITETPLDMLAIEQSGAYHGHYFILMGKISPLEGIGPKEIGLHCLEQRVQAHPVREVIFALGVSVEGQTTLHCIQTLLQSYAIEFSQLARGIPLGGELSLLDSYTISSALQNRSSLPN